MTAAPLAHLRVLDFTAELGALCGKILADLGADVLRVEPPGGCPLRHRGPSADGVAAPEAGLAWWAYAGGARSLVLDLETAEGRRRALEIARRADIVVESFPPGYLEQRGLGWDALHGENPRVILTSITPFGQDGPRRAWKGPEIVIQAMSGMMNLIGDRDRAPVRIGGDQASLQAAGQAVVGTLVAYLERNVTGQGQWVDVSAQVAMLWTTLSESALPPLHGWAPTRDGVYTRAARFHRRLIFPCRDGFVAMIVGGGVLGASMMEELTAWMAREGAAPAFMRDRDWKAWDAAHLLSLGDGAQAEIDAVVDAVGTFVERKSKAELYEAALQRGLLLAPLMDAADLSGDEQLAGRSFLAPVPEPRLGRAVIHCGPFGLLSATPLIPPRPAPRLGEGGESAVREWSESRSAIRPGERGALSALSGLRVVDFAWVVTGPITGRLLAEFGADVIRVESARRLDPGRTLAPWAEGKAGYNRSQMFANANAGKRSVTLDLARLEARDLARRLVATADVVIESFTPGTMGRWGLDYASVRALKPDIVYLSTCQQGQTGPHAHYRGYGSLAAALAGFYTVTGWPDRPPSIVYGAYTDFIAHHFASAAVLAALDHRARTGEGQHIDIAQRETGLHFLAPEILEHTVNGRVASRRGNADEHAAPHNAYPCAGEDRWCAIACETDAEWRALVGVMGNPGWSGDSRYESLAGRKRHEPTLDAHIAAWTVAHDAHGLARRLQEAGVPAGAVQTCADVHQDPQIAGRPGLMWLEHPEMGRTPYEAWAFRLVGRDSGPRRAPCLGEHTDEVLRDVLGLTPDEIGRLRGNGALV